MLSLAPGFFYPQYPPPCEQEKALKAFLQRTILNEQSVYGASLPKSTWPETPQQYANTAYKINRLYSIVLDESHILVQAFYMDQGKTFEAKVVFYVKNRSSCRVPDVARPFLKSLLTSNVASIVLDFHGTWNENAHLTLLKQLSFFSRLTSPKAWRPAALFHSEFFLVDFIFAPSPDLLPLASSLKCVKSSTGAISHSVKTRYTFFYANSMKPSIPESIHDFPLAQLERSSLVQSQAYSRKNQITKQSIYLAPTFFHVEKHTECATETLFAMFVRNNTHILFQAFDIIETTQSNTFYDQRLLCRIAQPSPSQATLKKACQQLMEYFIQAAPQSGVRLAHRLLSTECLQHLRAQGAFDPVLACRRAIGWLPLEWRGTDKWEPLVIPTELGD